jgi:hypothetical protein
LAIVVSRDWIRVTSMSEMAIIPLCGTTTAIEMYSYIIDRASIQKHHVLGHVRIYDWAKD